VKTAKSSEPRKGANPRAFLTEEETSTTNNYRVISHTEFRRKEKERER